MEVVNTQPTVSKSKKKSFSLLFLLGLLLLGLLFYLFTSFGPWELFTILDVKEKENIHDDNYFERPEGSIYLTLAPTGTNSSNIYKLDIVTREIEEVFPDSFYKNYMSKISPDGTKMVFVRENVQNLSQVVLLDLESQEILEISELTTNFPRNPVFSLDGVKIAYHINEEGEEEFESFGDFGEGWSVVTQPENNSLFIYSLEDQKTKKIGMGAYPFFSSDSQHLIFLKNDALYTLNLATNRVERALSSMFEIGSLPEDEQEDWDWYALRFDFLPERELLLVTDAATWEIDVFKIHSWSPFEYEVVKEIQRPRPFWPVFSPDGKYFAVQLFDRSESVSKVSVFNIEKAEEEVDVNLFDFGYDVFITDWRL